MIGHPNIANFVFHHQESPSESAARESSEIKRKKRIQYEEKCEKMRASKLAAKEKRCNASVSFIAHETYFTFGPAVCEKRER